MLIGNKEKCHRNAPKKAISDRWHNELWMDVRAAALYGNWVDDEINGRDEEHCGEVREYVVQILKMFLNFQILWKIKYKNKFEIFGCKNKKNCFPNLSKNYFYSVSLIHFQKLLAKNLFSKIV